MKLLKKIIVSNNPPQSKNVAWFDTTTKSLKTPGIDGTYIVIAKVTENSTSNSDSLTEPYFTMEEGGSWGNNRNIFISYQPTQQIVFDITAYGTLANMDDCTVNYTLNGVEHTDDNVAVSLVDNAIKLPVDTSSLETSTTVNITINSIYDNTTSKYVFKK